MRRVSVGAKLAIVTVTMLIGAAAFAFEGLSERERGALMDAKQHSGERLSALFSLFVGVALEFEDDAEVGEALARLGKDPEVRYAAVWTIKGDKPVAEHRVDSAHASPAKPKLAGKVAVRREPDRIVLETPVRSDGAEVGVAMIEFSLDRENAAFEASRRAILMGTALVALFVGVPLLIATRRIVVRPLREVRDAARRLEAGEHSQVELRTRDELGDLAGTFNQMAEVIVEREARIAAANTELEALFENMGQAIFTFGPSLRVEQVRSAFTANVFGTTDLIGRPVFELLTLGADEATPEVLMLEGWLDALFSATPESWEQFLDLGPTTVVLEPEDCEAVELELAFRPFFEDGELERVLVVGSDVTEKRRIAREAQRAREQHERQISAMQRILGGGAHLFAEFLRGSVARCDRCDALLGLRRTLGTAEVEELFRHAHTIKGEARTFGLEATREAAAELEHRLSMLRSGPESERRRAEGAAELAEPVRALRDALVDARRRFVEASPLGEAVLDQITVSRRELAAVVAAVDGAGGTLRDSIDALASRPLNEAVMPLLDAIGGWAEADGKQARLSAEGRDVRIPARLAALLPGTLTHLVRNAVAHGIERVAERERLGKPAVGAVEVRADELPDGVRITISDDGSGVDVGSLIRAAEDAGIAPLPEPPEALIFISGVSTRTSGLSGLGVGLDAVKKELADVGYSIRIESRKGQGACFTIEPDAPAGASKSA